MEILLSIVDFIVLVLLVIRVSRIVARNGSMLLFVCIASAIGIFAMVSFVINAALIERSSSLMRGLLLAFLLMVMMILVRASWSDETAE